jgi:hypothetical protein
VVEFGAVDVDVANVVSFEPLALFGDLGRRQSGDAMALKAVMQGASAQVWDGVLQTAEDIVERQEGSAPEFDDDGFLGRRQDCWGDDPTASSARIGAVSNQDRSRP